MAANKAPVVFIHGLWLHAESWAPWEEYFQSKGYKTSAASWPGDGPTTEATRQNASAVAGYGVTAIADHIAEQVKALGEKPILIGHSFGGLLVQNLLGRDLGMAGVAIDPAPVKGVPELPGSVLKASFPVLGNPFNFGKAIMLTEPQFRYGFTNAVSEQEAHELYQKYAMPGPAKVIFQAAMATFNPNSETKVNTANAARGPLLLTSGTEDHTVPPVLVKSTLRVYGKSGAVTEMQTFPGRSHSLTIDSRWKELADAILPWLEGKGF